MNLSPLQFFKTWIFGFSLNKNILPKASLKLSFGFFLFCFSFNPVLAELTKENVESLATLYDFEKPLFIKDLIGGMANTPQYVYTMKNGVEIGLGVFKGEIFGEEVAIKQLIFLEKMQNSGFIHLPRIIKNARGDYLTDIDGKLYSCLEYLLADQPFPEYPSAERRISFSQLLELIGKFHASAQHCLDGQDLHFNEIEVYKNKLPIFSNQLLKACDPIFHTRIWEQITHLSPFYASPEFEKIYNALPKQVVHGDSHFLNIVISKKTPYFVDFDLMHYGLRLWDLACCILYGYFDEFLEKAENDTLFSFLESNYEKGGIKLEDLEKEYLIEIIKFREMDGIGWILMVLSQALADHDTEKFELFRTHLLHKIFRMEKLFIFQNSK